MYRLAIQEIVVGIPFEHVYVEILGSRSFASNKRATSGLTRRLVLCEGVVSNGINLAGHDKIL